MQINAIPYTGIWYDTVNLAYETTLSYNVSTRVLTITPTGSNYRVWVNGATFVFTGAQTISHANTQGIWFIYYNAAGILTASQTAWNILNTAPIALLYYDATTPDYWLFDERHHFDTPTEWHQSQHFAIGTFIKNPSTDFVLGSYTLGTDTDAAVQWSMTTGTAVDEDIELLCSAVAAGGPYQVMYKSGASGNWIRVPNTTVPYTYNPGGYIYYNQYTGGSWQLTAMTSANRLNYYVFGTLGYETTKQLMIIPGQTTFGSLAAAQAESVTALNLTGFPTLEFVPLYQITFHTLAGYSHTGKCEIEGVQKIFGSHSTLSLASPTFTNPMTTLGDMITGDIGGSPVRLAGNATTTPYVLSSTGTGAAATAPTWITSTGTGSNVLATSPTLVTPALGNASATGLTLSGSTVGIVIPTGTPSPTTNALYNISGVLGFNGGIVGSNRPVSYSTGTTSVTAASLIYLINSSSPCAANMPAGVSGTVFTIRNVGTANVTVTPNGADTIETLSSFLLYPTNAIDLVYYSGNWYIL